MSEQPQEIAERNPQDTIRNLRESLRSKRDLIDQLRDQLATAVQALELILESDAMLTSVPVLMIAHKRNLEIAADAVAKVKEVK